jgi:hypothetical protein
MTITTMLSAIELDQAIFLFKAFQIRTSNTTFGYK